MKRYPLKSWRRHLSAYRPEEDAFDPRQFERVARVARHYAEYFSAELRGAEGIPAEGPALLVGNHGPWGIETPALLYRLWEHTGRVVRPLAEHLLIKLPLVGRLFRQIGAVDGRPENAVRLLEEGNLVLVYPGGHHDAFKSLEQAYRLQWEGARGYVRCAIRAGAPIIPIAGIGIDEAFLSVARERWLGRRLFGRTDYDFPITLGLGLLPFPVQFTFVVGPTIPVEVGEEAAEDPVVVERLHRRVCEVTQELIDRARHRRFSPAE
jgi:1-acyl-sn-glycerol-3-phosphate acyltransferase